MVMIVSNNDCSNPVKPENKDDTPTEPQWELIYKQPCKQVFVHPFEKNLIFVVNNDCTGVLSEDTGKTWQQIQLPFPEEYFEIYEINSQCILARNHQTLIISTDNAKTWINGNCSVYDATMDNNSTIWIGNFWGLYFSTIRTYYSSSSWQKIKGTKWVSDIEVIGEHLFINRSSIKLIHSPDYGETLTDTCLKTEDIGAFIEEIFKSPSGAIFVLSSEGCLYYIENYDQTENWLEFNRYHAYYNQAKHVEFGPENEMLVIAHNYNISDTITVLDYFKNSWQECQEILFLENPSSLRHYYRYCDVAIDKNYIYFASPRSGLWKIKKP